MRNVPISHSGTCAECQLMRSAACSTGSLESFPMLISVQAMHPMRIGHVAERAPCLRKSGKPLGRMDSPGPKHMQLAHSGRVEVAQVAVMHMQSRFLVVLMPSVLYRFIA
jgi:hypothetical protein